MRIIEKQSQKVELLCQILLKNIFSGKYDKDDYLPEAYEIVEIIDGITTRSIVAQLVEDYYVKNATNDHFSDFEELAKYIADEYISKVSKL